MNFKSLTANIISDEILEPKKGVEPATFPIYIGMRYSKQNHGISMNF